MSYIKAAKQVCWSQHLYGWFVSDYVLWIKLLFQFLEQNSLVIDNGLHEKSLRISYYKKEIHIKGNRIGHLTI